MAAMLTTNSHITHLDLEDFSFHYDQGEGAVVLSALASSESLPTITHFRCGRNSSWWSEGKESNVELLCNAIRAMTDLKYLDLYWSYNFSNEVNCEEVVNAIVDNAE